MRLLVPGPRGRDRGSLGLRDSSERPLRPGSRRGIGDETHALDDPCVSPRNESGHRADPTATREVEPLAAFPRSRESARCSRSPVASRASAQVGKSCTRTPFPSRTAQTAAWPSVAITDLAVTALLGRSLGAEALLQQLVQIGLGTPGFVGCQAGLGQACIGPEGEVSPCVMLPLIVGNIRERSFAEIWTQSPTLDALRDRSLLEGRCGTCALRAKCGGCRAVAYAYTGNVLASDPRCWRDAAAA